MFTDGDYSRWRRRFRRLRDPGRTGGRGYRCNGPSREDRVATARAVCLLNRGVRRHLSRIPEGNFMIPFEVVSVFCAVSSTARGLSTPTPPSGVVSFAGPCVASRWIRAPSRSDGRRMMQPSRAWHAAHFRSPFIYAPMARKFAAHRRHRPPGTVPPSTVSAETVKRPPLCSSSTRCRSASPAPRLAAWWESVISAARLSSRTVVIVDQPAVEY